MTKAMDKNANYQDLKTELDDVIFNLQRDDLGVDEMIELYEKGQKLIKRLEDYLKTAENKITKLKTEFE
jgi:exodeoxyribonuclease VII small subunit